LESAKVMRASQVTGSFRNVGGQRENAIT